MARGLWGVAIFTFALALTTRVLNFPLAFAGNVPLIAPSDELYHWKRIAYSARNFPQVLERDEDRGAGGAFVPWPPLYDFTAGAIARVIGISRIVWLPPFLGAIAVAIAATLIGKRHGVLAASTAGVALATSPFIVTQSSIGNIDHHFLEWPLTFFIWWAVTRHDDATTGRQDDHHRPVVVPAGRAALAVAMIAAMFTQTALITACGLAFLADRTRWRAFLATAGAIALYRLTRSSGYPDSAWFLGWPHAALFLAAAAWSRSRGLAIAIGLAAASALTQGATFFGGDRWLETIVEFQPMWRSTPDSVLSQLFGLSIGALFVWFLLRKERTLATFAIAFLILTIVNRRFWSVSIPLLAIAGAVYAASLRQRAMRYAAAIAVAAIPAVQLAIWMQHPTANVQRFQLAWLRAADAMRAMPRGRVLAPWSLGHAIDVRGGKPVVIDPFGSMPDPILFDRAQDALLSRDETRLARFCDETGVRYIAIYDPEFGVKTAAKILGVELTRRQIESLWWWRAFYERATFERFHEVYRSDAGFSRAAISVWEYTGHVREPRG